MPRDHTLAGSAFTLLAFCVVIIIWFLPKVALTFNFVSVSSKPTANQTGQSICSESG
jgi:hypothetical protein